MHFMTSHKHIVDILILITTSQNCNIDIWNYNCDYPNTFMDSQKKTLNVKRACHSWRGAEIAIYKG